MRMSCGAESAAMVSFGPRPWKISSAPLKKIKRKHQSDENSMLRLAGLAKLEIMIGVMGFSSGGHLASYASSVELEHRPVFQILVYPSTGVETPPHDPWRARLGFPGPETNTFKLVNSNTPPTLIVMSTEDTTTTYGSNGQPYVDACEAHGVPCEKILKPMGRHGFGLAKEWKAPCEEWMAKHGWCDLDVPKRARLE